MDLRTTDLSSIARAREALERVNARHPWSHNEHFHGWILRSLPRAARRALDVGCGRGDLLAALHTRVAQVEGIDSDAAMAQVARERFEAVPGVSVRQAAFPADAGTGAVYDAITMLAVLHHLELEPALARCAQLLRPGGRLLVVGLAPPVGALDIAWDVANALSNPLIGLIKHPHVARAPIADPQMPLADPCVPLAELRRRTEAVLPGARFRRREGFRYTMRWEKPAAC